MPSSFPSSMRGVVIDHPGAEGSLRLADLPLPVVSAGEVLVRVAYAGVNRADLLQKRGMYDAPGDASSLPGLEVSGYVAALGAGVSGLSVGTPIMALTHGGGYAEYVTIPASQAIAVPPSLSLAEAATLPEALATCAMALLIEAGLQDGERVLVHGGASGIGVIMVQVAVALGGTVFSTASPAKHSLIRTFGATPLAYDAEGFADSARAAMGGNGVDIIIDTLGGPYVAHHLKLLDIGGRMVSIAVLEGSKATISAASLLMKRLRWIGATLRSRSVSEKEIIMARVRASLLPKVASGAIRPVLDSQFSLAEAEKAHIRMENRLNSGKIVLEVQPET